MSTDNYIYDEVTREYAKHKENSLKKLEFRVHEEKSRTENRDSFMRDYARVLYSSSFRRLQGKMQLLGIDNSKFNRNRLTHSLEVAQIARGIATDLQLKNPIVSEMAALAHDIGNPPFGHHGEKVLNELTDSIGGFEGNAQTLRILRNLEVKSHNYNGLNLNIRSLLSVVKYFNTREEAKKFIYDEDYVFLLEKLKWKNFPMEKTIDAQIMDLADEIAYAAHDLEDALSFNMVNLGEIVHEFKINKTYSSGYETISKLAKEVQQEAMLSQTHGTSEQYATVLKKELTSRIVNMLCRDIGLVEHNGKTQLGYKNYASFSEGLKKLLFKAILRKKDVQLYEIKGEKVIKGLFEIYSDKSFNKNNMLLPPELRYLIKENTYLKERIIADYISGMMDSYAIQEYEKFHGKGSSNQLV